MIIDKQYNEPNSSDLRPRRIAVIGAGIAGISCAFFLARDGHKVTIIDPNEPGSGASYGNSGAINESSVMPSSTPGLIKKIPKMLMDPESLASAALALSSKTVTLVDRFSWQFSA